MPTIAATATEDIPANRFLTTSLDDGNQNIIGIEVTKKDWDPDFYTGSDIQKGTKVILGVGTDDVWQVEAGTDIDAGRPVGNGGSGKVVDRKQVDGLTTCGIAVESVSKGEVCYFWPTTRINGPVAEDLLKGGSGGGGQSWSTEKTVDAVNAALEAGSNLSKSYDDKNGIITVDATDAQFSGQWADLTGIPNSFPPEQHGNGSHTATFATQSELFSGNWNDVSNKPTTYPPDQHDNAQHSTDYATQSALSSLEQRVTDLENQVGGGGGGQQGGGQK